MNATMNGRSGRSRVSGSMHHSYSQISLFGRQPSPPPQAAQVPPHPVPASIPTPTPAVSTPAPGRGYTEFQGDITMFNNARAQHQAQVQAHYQPQSHPQVQTQAPTPAPAPAHHQPQTQPHYQPQPQNPHPQLLSKDNPTQPPYAPPQQLPPQQHPLQQEDESIYSATLPAPKPARQREPVKFTEPVDVPATVEIVEQQEVTVPMPKKRPKSLTEKREQDRAERAKAKQKREREAQQAAQRLEQQQKRKEQERQANVAKAKEEEVTRREKEKVAKKMRIRNEYGGQRKQSELLKEEKMIKDLMEDLEREKGLKDSSLRAQVNLRRSKTAEGDSIRLPTKLEPLQYESKFGKPPLTAPVDLHTNSSTDTLLSKIGDLTPPLHPQPPDPVWSPPPAYAVERQLVTSSTHVSKQQASQLWEFLATTCPEAVVPEAPLQVHIERSVLEETCAGSILAGTQVSSLWAFLATTCPCEGDNGVEELMQDDDVVHLCEDEVEEEAEGEGEGEEVVFGGSQYMGGTARLEGTMGGTERQNASRSMARERLSMLQRQESMEEEAQGEEEEEEHQEEEEEEEEEAEVEDEEDDENSEEMGMETKELLKRYSEMLGKEEEATSSDEEEEAEEEMSEDTISSA